MESSGPEHFYQNQDEPLASYYNRAVKIISRTRAGDRPQGVTLSSLESATLGAAMRFFFNELFDKDAKKDDTRHVGQDDQSLLGLRRVAEDSERAKSDLKQYNEGNRSLETSS